MQKEEKETTPRKHNKQLKHTASSVEPRNAMFSVCLLVSSGWSVLFNMFVLLFTTLCCQVLPICLPRKSTPRTTICYMCVGFPRLVCLFLLCIVSNRFSWFSTFLHKCGTRTDSARFAHVCVCVCVCKASHVHVSMSLVPSVFHECGHFGFKSCSKPCAPRSHHNLF